LLTCAFHWYAVSACQYVRTVRAISYRHDPRRPIPPEYVNAVLPEVLAFRDKVAAHFAFSTQNSRDNDAERLASVLPPLTFVDDSFHVGAFTVSIRNAGKASTSDTMQPWSICKVHEQLRRRYWPESTQAALVRDAQLVEVTDIVKECRDPKDDKFLELAVSGRASHIVSGDADLLIMHPYRGIEIVTPQEFLALSQGS
jgi:hypothetical protein